MKLKIIFFIFILTLVSNAMWSNMNIDFQKIKKSNTYLSDTEVYELYNSNIISTNNTDDFTYYSTKRKLTHYTKSVIPFIIKRTTIKEFPIEYYRKEK